MSDDLKKTENLAFDGQVSCFIQLGLITKVKSFPSAAHFEKKLEMGAHRSRGLRNDSELLLLTRWTLQGQAPSDTIHPSIIHLLSPLIPPSWTHLFPVWHIVTEGVLFLFLKLVLLPKGTELFHISNSFFGERPVSVILFLSPPLPDCFSNLFGIWFPLSCCLQLSFCYFSLRHFILIFSLCKALSKPVSKKCRRAKGYLYY